MPHTNRFRFVLLFLVVFGFSLGWMLGGCGSVTSSELVTDDAGGAGGAGGASSDAGDGSAGEAGPSAGGHGGAAGAGGAASDGGTAGTGSTSNAGAGGSSAGGTGASAGAGGGISTAPPCAGEFRGADSDCQVLAGWHCAPNCGNDLGGRPVACVYQAASIYCVAKCSDCRP